MNQPTFTLTVENQDGKYGRFVIEPLANGFGHTLGNALRRILLSNLKGAAITKVKVEGLNHKFSTLDGLNEDMIELILNLKKVKLAYDKDESASGKLEAKGPKVVTAGDIKFPSTVRVVNPESVIATLAKGAKLSMDIEVQSGYGYSPADERMAEVIGEIPVDALYSPVERVAYKIEKTRVGRQTDFDKLVLEIYTDGSQKPEAVLKEAAAIAVSYFQQVFDPQEEQPSVSSAPSPSSPEVYSLTVEELGLPTRIANALKNGGYKTIGDLMSATQKDLKSIKNLGGKSLELVKKSLKSKGVILDQ